MWSIPHALISASLLTMALVGYVQPAQAQLRQTHPATAAIEGSVSVTVWPGSGTNIDFSALGESVYRVWLDDPSRITVDTDSDLSGGAQVIHLRRIEGVDFAGLPATARTLLTVATIDPSRQTTLYQFPIFYDTGAPDYSTIALTLPSAPVVADPRIPLSAAPFGGVTVDAIETGLAVAIREGKIAADGPLATRVNDYIALIRQGSTPAAAAAATGVEVPVIEALAAASMRVATEPESPVPVIEVADDAVPEVSMPVIVPLSEIESPADEIRFEVDLDEPLPAFDGEIAPFIPTVP
ncbi:MAG: hypothetical protein ACFB0G_23530 [Leptolyngbyaceae cyanobacterium]